MVTYDLFKIKVFEIIKLSSRSLILPRLKKLSEDFNIPLKDVINDFNEYTWDLWEIKENEV